jgi:hypothetical protein
VHAHIPTARHASPYASESLEQGSVYTRDFLRRLFKITASSINSGVFKPAPLSSVWLFITENKTSDRTQYVDLLDGDILFMEGQSKGRTDYLIREHVQRGLELLVFYRKEKYQYPGAGFVFEGKFKYISECDSGPTKFTLLRENPLAPTISSIRLDLDSQGAFDPTGLADARARMIATIVRRQGQAAFRQQLLHVYSSRCAVTGCTIEAVLEAAHITPYLGAGTNVTCNGILLRADIHSLFDLKLLWIDPDTFRIGIADQLKSSEYGLLENRIIYLPEQAADRPSVSALRNNLDAILKKIDILELQT